MLNATVYNGETSWLVAGTEAISSAVADESNLVWVDLCGPLDEELDAIAEGLDLHRKAPLTPE